MKWKKREKKLAWNSTFKKLKIMATGHITSWLTEGEKVEAVTDFFLSSKITVDGDCSHDIKRICSLEGKPWQTDSVLKSRDITLLTKVCMVKAMVFPVVTNGCWEWDHQEGSVPKKWCFLITVLEKTLQSPLDCKIKSVNPRGNQPWIFIGRADAEAEVPVLWPHDGKN